MFLCGLRGLWREEGINREAVLVTAIFHDVGYAVSSSHANHAKNSAILCEEYLKEKRYHASFIDYVTYLVKNHSSKELMTKTNTPIELITLMEADLLDETGALSIIWDCMLEGCQKSPTFEKAFNHIRSYSYKYLSENPMVTAKAKHFWYQKYNLAKEFVDQLAYDLGINEALLQ